MSMTLGGSFQLVRLSKNANRMLFCLIFSGKHSVTKSLFSSTGSDTVSVINYTITDKIAHAKEIPLP